MSLALGFPDVVTEEGLANGYVGDLVSRHIARELHDQVASPLISLVLELDEMRRKNAGDADITQQLAVLEESARQVLRRTRELLLDMRGQDGLQLNLVDVLRSDVIALFERRASISLVVSDSWPIHVNGWSAFNISRIVHEAVTNAIRHGHAREISIVLDVTAFGEAVVMVVDDGDGFEGVTGMGMVGMRERAVVLGGTFSAGSDDNGTRIEVRVPKYRLE